MEYKYLVMACRSCGAPAGELCRLADGGKRSSPHMKRIEDGDRWAGWHDSTAAKKEGE